MRWLRSILAVFLVAGLGVLTVASPACACSCAGVSAREAFDSADAVFVGRVVEIDEPGGLIVGSADPVTLVFDVGEVFKGVVPANVHVVTARDGASCGFDAVAGARYVIYAYEDEAGELATTLCSRNQQLSAAGPVPVDLVPGAGYPPASPVDYPSDRWWLPYTVGAAALLLVGLGIVIAVRARRRARATR